MRLRYVFCALPLLACTDEQPDRDSNGQSAPGWTVLADSAPAESRVRAAELERERISTGIPLTFWLRRDSVPSDTTGLSIGEHPCGMTVTALWRSIPRNHPVAETDPVVEFDHAGRAIAQWLIPPDTRIVGVQGGEILIADIVADGEPPVYFAVTASDSFRVLPAIPVDSGIPQTCPALVEFEGSVFGVCRTFRDALSRSQRRLAFQNPCT